MTAPELEKITTTQFVDRIQLGKLDALVKIGSRWNGACQLLSSTLQELAQQHIGKLDFFYADQETEPTLSSVYRIDTIPTILFFKKGTLVDKLSGLHQKVVISNKIIQLINS